MEADGWAYTVWSLEGTTLFPRENLTTGLIKIITVCEYCVCVGVCVCVCAFVWYVFSLY